MDGNDIISQIVANLGTMALVSLFERGQRKKHERLEQFVRDLGNRLSRLEAKCDDEYFVELVSRCAQAFQNDAREEKFIIASLVLESAYCAEIDDAWGRIFVDLIARFDTVHFMVLRILRDTDGSDKGPGGDEPPAVGFAFVDTEIRDGLGRDSPEVTDVSTLALSDLINAGLVHTRSRAKARNAVNIGGVNSVGMLRGQVFRLSHLGVAFCRLIGDHSQRSP